MRHLELLSGGLVTSKDPVALAVGEMSVMQNLVYRPGDLAPQRASGRDVFGTVSATATPVRGLRDLKFDNGDHFLLAMASATLSTALVGATGAFGAATNFTASGTALDAIQFNNRWYLFGGGENLVLYVSATAGSQPLKVRGHGLLAQPAQVSATLGAGTWTAGSTGFFEYWMTELLEYTQDGVTASVESSFSGQPFTLLVSSTATQATITIPGAPTNPAAQKWILYRGGPKTLATDKEFPIGFELGRGTFGTNTTVVDGGATTGSYAFCNATASIGTATAFTNPTNVFTSDGVFATKAGSLSTGTLIVTFPSFASVVDPVVGLTMGVEGKVTGGTALVNVSVSNDSGATFYGSKSVPLVDANTLFELGGVSDLWSTNWTAGDVVAGRFRVKINGMALSGATVSIDSIKAKFTYAGSKQLDESRPFPSLIISAADVDAAVGSHGPPPPATTGDIFQGTLVTNSRTAGEQALIRYSLPSEPDYFPAPYFLDFETPDNDIVTNIKTLNNRLGVFLAARTYRVNYLPTEADSNFNRGICREEVSSQHGCVNAMCATVYEGPGGRSEIAFVSDVGIHSTDLFSLRDLTNHLDWRSVIAAAGSTPIALVNDPEHGELLFFYKNTSVGNEHYKCLHLSYDGTHLTGGRLKISGPVNMRNHSGGIFADVYSAWAVRRSNGVSSVYLGYGGDSASTTAAGAGKVYIETGDNSPALDSTAKFRTRRMYLVGLGNEVRLDRLFCYTSTGSAPQTLTITPCTTRANIGGITRQAGRNFAWDDNTLFYVEFPQSVAGLEIEVAQASNNAGAIAFHNVLVDYVNYGVEDSGTSLEMSGYGNEYGLNYGGG